MSAKNLIFAYSQENIKIAQKTDQELGTYIGPITHLPGGRTTAAPSLSEQILNQKGRVVIFISDNFLKSAQCMSNGLRLLQSKGADILPVIIPGEYTDEETGEISLVETSFDRVSDIIQYINYWQDRYLDLRRQKRQLEEEIDEEKFNEHLKKMREISSEVGEFLRLLRTTEYITYPEFIQNDYEALFKFIGDLNARDAYRKNRAEGGEEVEIAGIPKVVVMPLDDEEEVEEKSEETGGERGEMREEGEKTVENNEKSMDEDLDFDIGSIPGIELLREEEEEGGERDEEGEKVEMGEKEDEGAEEELIGDASDLYEQHPEEFKEEVEISPETMETAVKEEEESRTLEFEVESSLETYDKEEEEEEEEEDVDIDTIIEEALSLLENGSTSHGFSHFTNAIENHPNEANLRYQYAIALVRYKKDFQNASNQLVEAIQADPEFEDAYFLLGELSEITENFEGAKQAYELLANLNADYPKVQFRLGIVLANHFEGQEKAAMKALKLALKQDPDIPDAYYQYGVLVNEYQNKPQKAIKYFRATLDRVPDHPFAWYDLALLYHGQDQRKKAYKAYLKAVEINPELKTDANDQAFQVLDKKKKKELEEIADSFREKNTIDALKENIFQLEALLQAREEELQKETEAKESVLAQTPPRPGEGKTVFISGATAGIGKATAAIFAQNGYRLIINGRRIDRLEEMRQQFMDQYDVAVKILPFDISNANAVNEAINGLENEWHPIDILINNAGKARGFAPVHEGELVHWEEMIDTNLKGLLYLTRAISPYMVARNKGHIINVCSIVGKEVYPNGNVYCATKHAVDALTRAMRLDLLKHNIRVSQVSPAAVEETEFAMVRYDGDANRAAKTYEDFKPLTSGDVAEAIYFIASQPFHVNVQDILMMGTQQASSTQFNRSGRDQFEEEE